VDENCVTRQRKSMYATEGDGESKFADRPRKNRGEDHYLKALETFCSLNSSWNVNVKGKLFFQQANTSQKPISVAADSTATTLQCLKRLWRLPTLTVAEMPHSLHSAPRNLLATRVHRAPAYDCICPVFHKHVSAATSVTCSKICAPVRCIW
jgi:hypothetical protein